MLHGIKKNRVFWREGVNTQLVLNLEIYAYIGKESCLSPYLVFQLHLHCNTLISFVVIPAADLSEQVRTLALENLQMM